jgi:hypothetical protein
MDTSGPESKELQNNQESKQDTYLVITGFHRKVIKKSALPGHYTANSGNSLPTFRDNLLGPSSRLKARPLGCTKASARNYHYSLRNDPEERSSVLIQFVRAHGVPSARFFSPARPLLFFCVALFCCFEKFKITRHTVCLPVMDAFICCVFCVLCCSVAFTVHCYCYCIIVLVLCYPNWGFSVLFPQL